MVILTSSSNNSIKQATIRKRNANINKTAISRVRSAWKKGFEAIKPIIKAQISYLTRAGRNTPIRRKSTIKINATAKNVRTSGHQLIATRANVDMI